MKVESQTPTPLQESSTSEALGHNAAEFAREMDGVASRQLVASRGGSLQTSIERAVLAERPNYDVSRLNLHEMNSNDQTRLLGFLSKGNLSVEENLQQVERFQRYMNYDNQTTTSALREIYFDAALDPFIAGADQITPEIYNLDNAQGDHGGVTRSQAALSRASLMLTLDNHATRPPVLQVVAPPGGLGIVPEGEDIGFDHVITGLDGQMNFRTGMNGFVNENAIRVLGGHPETIRSQDAVTWLGDLAGTVQVGLQTAPGTPRGRWREGIPAAAASGYEAQMTIPDEFGNRLGVGLTVDPNRHNLAQVLGDGLRKSGGAYQQRFTTFADNIGLEYDSRGNLTNQEEWIEDNIDNVVALGQGLAQRRNGAAGHHRIAESLAQVNMERWTGNLQSGLRSELR